MFKLSTAIPCLLLVIIATSSTALNPRDEIITCKEGSGLEQDYRLEYRVFTDFDVPHLETTKITSRFKAKEDAYIFAKKYSTILDKNGRVVTTRKNIENENYYFVSIEKNEKAKLKTIDEYKEMAKSFSPSCHINKKGS